MDVAYALLVENAETPEKREELDMTLMLPESRATVRELTGDPEEDYVPPWWHGEDAAYVEGLAARSWMNRVGGKVG